MLTDFDMPGEEDFKNSSKRYGKDVGEGVRRKSDRSEIAIQETQVANCGSNWPNSRNNSFALPHSADGIKEEEKGAGSPQSLRNMREWTHAGLYQYSRRMPFGSRSWLLAQKLRIGVFDTLPITDDLWKCRTPCRRDRAFSNVNVKAAGGGGKRGHQVDRVRLLRILNEALELSELHHDDDDKAEVRN